MEYNFLEFLHPTSEVLQVSPKYSKSPRVFTDFLSTCFTVDSLPVKGKEKVWNIGNRLNIVEYVDYKYIFEVGLIFYKPQAGVMCFSKNRPFLDALASLDLLIAHSLTRRLEIDSSIMPQFSSLK